MIDIRQSKNYADYLSSIGWIVERIDGINYFIKKFPLIGSIIKIQRPEKNDYKKINLLAKKYRAFQIILEPKQKLTMNNLQFKISKSPYLPTKTLQIDLTQSKEKIFNQLKKDCKSAIEKNDKLKIKEMKNIEEFKNAWKKSVGLKRYVPPLSHLTALKKSFKNNSSFLLTADSSAGAIFLLANDTAYYWQAFTNKIGRKNNYQYKIVWEGILWAKKSGAKVFDFEGIFDERFPNKSWLGFTHFKKSFGGTEVEYPGCYTKLQLPI